MELMSTSLTNLDFPQLNMLLLDPAQNHSAFSMRLIVRFINLYGMQFNFKGSYLMAVGTHVQTLQAL
jgi:hypothetical protein